MSDASTNRNLYDRPRISSNRKQEPRAVPKPPGVAESEFAAAVHEGASSVDRVREYLKQRKHPFR